MLGNALKLLLPSKRLKNWTIPGLERRYSSNGTSVKNGRNQRSVLKPVQCFSALSDHFLGVDDGRIMLVVVQVDVVIAMIFEPVAINVKSNREENKKSP